MALTAKRAARVLTKGEPGRHFDDVGLYLVVTGKGSGSWERRYMLHGKEHYYGLGPVSAFSLAEARERNRRVSQLLADGIDPLVQKHADRAARQAQAARAISFGECAEEFFRTNLPTWKNVQHVRQWAATVLGRTLGGKPVRHDYCRTLRRMPVQQIDTPVVMSVLKPIWHDKPETANRTRARIHAVLDWAKAAGYRTGDNPADWTIIGKLLPARGKVRKVEHFEALNYRELPAFMAALRKRHGTAARALEFLILCAVRTGSVLEARWPEIDLNEGVWTVPAERMKGGKEHRVPLSAEALELLRQLPREEGNDFVFIGPHPGKPLSKAALMAVMKRMDRSEVVHGFRSSFSDWAHERTAHSNHTIEISLAHAVGSDVERSYRRGDMFEKRRRLMEAWCRYCCSPPAAEEKKGKVLPMHARGAAR
jgi:integrase